MTRAIDAEMLVAELSALYASQGWDKRDAHFSLADMECNVAMIPTLEIVPIVRAEWMEAVTMENGLRLRWNKCSACGWLRHVRTPYCQNCGAKMEGTT